MKLEDYKDELFEELEKLFCISTPEVQKAFSLASIDEVNRGLKRATTQVAKQFPHLLSASQKEILEATACPQKLFLACPCAIPMQTDDSSWSQAVNTTVEQLILSGYIVFSPLSKSMGGNISLLPSYWRQFCLSMLSWADALAILPEKGWENHPEVQDWMVRARILGIPLMTITKDREFSEFFSHP